MTVLRKVDEIYPTGLNRAAFEAWAQERDGKWELWGGTPVAMAGGSILHGETKFAAALALRAALKAANFSCMIAIDDPRVPVAVDRSYIPDVVVRCGPPHQDRAKIFELDDPVIVVEVLSRRDDDPAFAKVRDYFTLPSLAHMLIVDPFRSVVIHNSRMGNGVLATIVAAGPLRLDPPGIEVQVEELLTPA